MDRSLRRWLGVLIVLVLGCSLSLRAAEAMSVSPAVFDLQGEPGEKVMGSFLLKNDEERAVTYYFSLQSFTPDSETVAPVFLPFKETAGLPS